MTIKGIFFDAADVLYYRPVSTDSYVSNLLARRGYATELSAEDWMRNQALRSQAKSGRLSPNEYWDRLLLMRGVAAPEERKTLVAKINDHSNHILPIPGGREMLAGLKQRGFVLGIVTDTMYPIEWKMRWLNAVGVAEFIDVVACSTVLGAHKPDPAMYLNAVQQAHLTAGESVFVGHDAEELEGARRAGMATVAVNYAPGTIADYYARSLVDLLDVPIFQFCLEQSRGEAMNHNNIEIIFIDVGNTLRILVEDEAFQAQARERIAMLVGVQESPESFCERLAARYKVYRKWAFETLTEASEKELWTRWMLPDYPPAKIAPLSGELTYLYRRTMGRRFAAPDAEQVVVELTKRGYQLGIISNTITEREIPEWLKEDGLSQYFPTVVLSSIFGRRKPGPEIYLEATRRAGVDPARAAYVADNPARDVPGSRRAGFGMVIMMVEPADLEKKDFTGENKPDLIIHKLSELLSIFPPRPIPRDGN
jgi:putative hydrolase of the HAD superfamily